MAKTIRLSERSARALQAFHLQALEAIGAFKFPFVATGAFREIEHALERLNSPKRRSLRKTKRVAESITARIRREDRQGVRDSVMTRAAGQCECGCGRYFHEPYARPELDHFFGRSRSETSRSCWALSWECHRNKTDSDPSAAEWLNRFIRHCERHGFDAEATKARARLAFVTTRAELAGREAGP